MSRIGVLKLIYQNVAVPLRERRTDLRTAAQQVT